MRLLLIRHGQTPSNVLGLLDTAVPGPGLTDLGQQQAAALPETLADYRIDAIYASSPAPRAAHRRAARGRPDHARCRSGTGCARSAPATWRCSVTIGRSGPTSRPSGNGWSGELDGHDARWTERRGGARPVRRGGRRGGRPAPRLAGEDGCAVLFAHGAMLRLWATVRASEPGDRRGCARPRALAAQHRDDRPRRTPPDGGWHVVSWAGRAIGGPRLDDGTADGPAGESIRRCGGLTRYPA